MKEITMEAVRELRATVEKVDEVIQKNNQSAAHLCVAYRHALYNASEAVGEAMELHKGLIFLLQMARSAIEDGMIIEPCFPTALLDIASSIEMRLDGALSTIEAARHTAA